MRFFRFCVFYFLVISGAASLAALDNADSPLQNYFLSISPRFGMFYGHAEEIVYSTSGAYPLKGHDDYLSLLEWDIKPVFYYGLDMELCGARPQEGRSFFSTLSLKYAIPGASGSMQDSDWAAKDTNARTHYSSHNNFTDEIFSLDFTAGLSFPLRRILFIKPLLSFSYTRFGFSGTDGEGLYATKISDGVYDFDNLYTRPYSGRVISYAQQWFILSPGVCAAFNFLDFFSFEAAFSISPAILLIDLDVHITTNTIFTDYLGGGLFLKPRARLSFAAGSWLSVTLEGSYSYIFKTRGAAYQRRITVHDTADYFSPGGEAGAGLSLFEAALLVKIRI